MFESDDMLTEKKGVIQVEIKKIYTQKIPATRFIGKKYGDGDRVNGSFGAKWEEAFNGGLFDRIEATAGKEEFFEDSGAYIGLMRCRDGDPFEYWIGMFTPAETQVPEGFGYHDFHAGELGIGWIYGNDGNGEIYCHEGDVAVKLGNEGFKIKNDERGACWFFERYQCPRFTVPDEKGNVILDIGFFIE